MSDKMDTISLIIGGQEIKDFESYRIQSDLFEAADAFSITLADPDLKIPAGSRCMLKVNGLTELNGIIDKVSREYDKTKRTLTVEGRDLMGLVADAYCTAFLDLEDIKLSDLAKLLLSNIPYVNRMPIKYGKGDKSRAVAVTEQEFDFKYIEITPGQTVFEVLKEKALQNGRIFFCLPDGTFMFGMPASGGKARFSFVCTKAGRNNNILRATLTDDIGKRYKTVTVMSQSQGEVSLDVGDHNIEASITDASFPFAKTYVATVDLDKQDPQNYARLIMDGQKFEGWQFELKVPEHSQNGKNYTVNAVCHVQDEILGLNADLLCHGRTFELDKNGISTTLRLSKLGVLPA